uniref:protein IQ-DOMAIN 17-like n=1 Tax=Erigeron canadensis TaxID=72917 RepID=UPI001CB96234|nr:protein IQ-DOMAIN 17-like [Erigeron canadensis]
MGKKGSWFTTLKRAFTVPKSYQDGLHGKIVEKRRWFPKSSDNVNQTSTNHSSKASQNLDSISVQRHFAATLIQTVFRGYLARKASKALKGIVMLQAMIRGQNVRNRKIVDVKYMHTLLHVHSRSSVKPSRSGSHMPDDQCFIPYTFEELNYILQARKEANLSHNINELQEQANYLVRWIEAEQWRVPREVVEVDRFLYESRNHQTTQCIPNSPSRRSSYSLSAGQQSVTPSPIKTKPSLVYSDNSRGIKGDRNDIATPNYMATTESAKAKTRSLTSPRQTSRTPRMERVSFAKKRLSYSVPDPSHNCKAYFHGYNN